MNIRKKSILGIAAATLIAIPAIGFAMGHGEDHGCNKGGKKGYHHGEMSHCKISNGHAVVIGQLQALLDSGTLSEEETASVQKHLDMLNAKSNGVRKYMGKHGKKRCHHDGEHDEPEHSTEESY